MMMPLEGIRLALLQIWAQKLKSVFALIGVVVGVTFLIVVVSIVQGMDEYIREDFSSQIFGVNTVILRRNPSVNISFGGASERNRARRPRITLDDLDALREQLTVPSRIGVESGRNGQVDGERGKRVSNVDIRGVSADVFEIRNLEVENGRLFSPQEDQRGLPVVVLGASTAEALFESLDPVGRMVRIRGFPFRVIGVLEEQGSLLGFSQDNLAITPAGSPLRRFLMPDGYVEQIIVQALDPDQVREAQLEMEGIMRVRHRLRPADSNDFALETAEQSLSIWESISSMLFIAFPMLVMISLVVGGIVIMNIMLVSVMERTREIGVRKALGARKLDIMTQVLIESGTLSGVGALIGIGIGLGVALIISSISFLPAAVPTAWISVGALGGIGVGVISGVYPAWRASKLDPVDALRYE